MPIDDEPCGQADGASRFREFLLLEREDLAADETSRSRPRREPEDQDESQDVRLEDAHQHEHQEERGKRNDDVHDPHEHVIDNPTEISGCCSVHGSKSLGNQHRAQTYGERDSSAV